MGIIFYSASYPTHYLLPMYLCLTRESIPNMSRWDSYQIVASRTVSPSEAAFVVTQSTCLNMLYMTRSWDDLFMEENMFPHSILPHRRALVCIFPAPAVVCARKRNVLDPAFGEA